MQTEQLTATSILSLFQTTKEQRQSFVMELIDRLETGMVDPLKVHFQVKAMEDIIKTVTDNKSYRNLVLESAQAFGQKKFNFQSASFEIKEVGTKYDYSQCNDPELQELEQKAASANEMLKARQKFLQTVPGEGLIITVQSTGETVTVYPPSKSSTTSVAVTMK